MRTDVLVLEHAMALHGGVEGGVDGVEEGEGHVGLEGGEEDGAAGDVAAEHLRARVRGEALDDVLGDERVEEGAVLLRRKLRGLAHGVLVAAALVPSHADGGGGEADGELEDDAEGDGPGADARADAQQEEAQEGGEGHKEGMPDADAADAGHEVPEQVEHKVGAGEDGLLTVRGGAAVRLRTSAVNAAARGRERAEVDGQARVVVADRVLLGQPHLPDELGEDGADVRRDDDVGAERVVALDARGTEALHVQDEQPQGVLHPAHQLRQPREHQPRVAAPDVVGAPHAHRPRKMAEEVHRGADACRLFQKSA